MKGSKKMEIVIAIISPLISAALTFIILTIINCNSKAEELDKLRVEHEKEIQEERFKNSRYCISNFLYADRNRELNNQLAEKDELIAELTHQADRANELIGALEAELSDLEPMTEKQQKSRLPKGHTNMFMGMPYDLITDKASDQYALQQKCITSKWSGIRVYHDDEGEYYYCVALGTAYGIDIGDTWKVTLRNGSEFNVILAEYKHDITDPDPNDFGDPCYNYDTHDCTNVIEFIYDEDVIPDCVLQAGTFTELDFFGGKYGDGGDIMKMEYLGKVWKR